MEEVDELVRRVRAGETEAYAEIIHRFERPAWRVVAAMLQDFEPAAEILQRVFIDAYVKLGQYRLGTDFEAWIKMIARNHVRQEMRRLSRERKHLQVYGQQLEERLKDQGAAAEQDDAYFEALRKCRAELPEKSAKALQRRYTDGWAFTEIAEEMRMTCAAVEKLLSRVRMALKDCIEQRLAHS